VRRPGRLRFQRADDDRFDLAIGDRPRRPNARLVVQARQAIAQEPLPPLPDRGVGGAIPGRDDGTRERLRAGRNQPRPEREQAIDRRAFGQPPQLLKLGVSEHERWCGTPHGGHAAL